MAQLFTPAHLHLAINHVPIIGLTVACLPVLIGILFHSRGALASGLLAVILCTSVMPAIMKTGGGAYDSFMDGSIEPGLDDAGKTALRQHAHRADATAPVVYAAGILALVALLALTKFPLQAAWISWAVLLGCTFAIALSVWTAEAGGRIRHSEFRPPEKSSPTPSPSASPFPEASPSASTAPQPSATATN
jgi:MFS superfamily sulfate permease-like transporter